MPAAARRLALLSTHLGASTAEHQQLDNPLVAVPTGLLKGLDPILTAELLYVLRMAGHGDVISIVDCNFPAAEVASKTFYGKPIMLAGVDLPAATAAICSICPLDRFVECPAQYMYPSPGSEVPALGVEVHDAIKAAVREFGGDDVPIEPLERFEFYDASRKAFAVVQCGGERRPYGNVLLQKGVVGPDGKDLLP